LRRSSVRDGIGIRITLPSLAGLRPRSDVRIAFSITAISEGSNGWAMIIEGSGIDNDATWLSGILLP
jgi:hypothetical protein